jgi:hypothetical protein
MARYCEFDVFLFPGLHDTGGYAVIEAMFNALPVNYWTLGAAPRPSSGTAPPAHYRPPFAFTAAIVPLSPAIAAWRIMTGSEKDN